MSGIPPTTSGLCTIPASCDVTLTEHPVSATAYVPRLNWVDAWLLAVLTDHRWRWSRPLKLWRLVDRADDLFRGEPSFDDLSFSLARLVAAGLIEVSRDAAGELQLKATRAGFDVKARAKGPGSSMRRFAGALGAEAYPNGDDGDRSLGRFPALTADDWKAVRERLDRVTFTNAD